MSGGLYTQHRKTPKKPESLASRVERYLTERGPATSAHMARVLKTGKSNVTHAICTLQRATPARVHTQSIGQTGEAIYAAGPKPHESAKAQEQASFAIAAPRQIIGSGPYMPAPWSPPRPGSSHDELGIPSRESCGYKPWRRPVHGCIESKKEARQ